MTTFEPNLGDYELEKEIGRGGMATVYLAHHRTDPVRSQVAIKLLHPSMAEDAEISQRFRREAELGGKLKHPHIVHAIEFVQEEGKAYLVLDYMPGGSLADRLEKKSRLSWEESVRILQQVGEALDFAHRKQVIHRDIKPSNILFDASGAACLADFGIAHDASAAKITGTDHQVGTIRYMAPEQFKGKKADARTDQFALATVFYQMVGGRAPFSGSDTASLINQILHEPPPPLPDNVDSPEGLARVLRRALNKEPSARFADIPSFIQAAIDPSRVSTGHTSGVIKRRKRKRKLWSWFLAFAGLVLGVVLVAVGVAWINSPGSTATPAAPTAPATVAAENPAVGGDVTIAPQSTSRGGGVATAVITPTPATGRTTKPVSSDEPTIAPTRAGTRNPVRATASTLTAPPRPTARATLERPTATPAANTRSVQILSPENGAAVSYETTFVWRSGFSLGAGELFEVVLWRQGQDPVRDGFGVHGATTDARITVNMAGVDRDLSQLEPGEYQWGVLLVRLQPRYERLAYLGGGRILRYDRPPGAEPFNSPAPPPPE